MVFCCPYSLNIDSGVAQKKLKEYTSKIPPLAVFPRESPFKYEKGGRKKTVDCFGCFYCLLFCIKPPRQKKKKAVGKGLSKGAKYIVTRDPQKI